MSIFPSFEAERVLAGQLLICMNNLAHLEYFPKEIENEI